MSPSLHVVCDWSAEVLDRAIYLLRSAAGPLEVDAEPSGRSAECLEVAGQLARIRRMNDAYREQQETLNFLMDAIVEHALDFQGARDGLFDRMAAAAQSPLPGEVVAA